MTNHTLACRAMQVLAGVLISSSTAFAQCATPWQPFGGVPGITAPNGSSLSGACLIPPSPAYPDPRLAVGGIFTTAGAIAANNVAAINLVTGEWTTFGTGASSYVHALTLLPNGDLVIGGDFTAAGGTAALRVARWDGTSWSSIGGGLNAPAYSLMTLGNGELLVGGHFTAAGGIAASRIARYDGTAWNALGAGCDLPVYCLAELANGDLVVGGEFTVAGLVLANRVARWDGSSWHAMGAGMNGNVRDLTIAPNGDVYASGSFTTAGVLPAPGIARWDGANWLPIAIPGATIAANGVTHARLANGDLVVSRLDASTGTVGLLRYDGTSWSSMASLSASEHVASLVPIAGAEMAVTGKFHAIGEHIANHVAIWNGSSFTPAPGGLEPVCLAIAAPGPGSSEPGPMVGTGAIGQPLRNARWSGSSWLDLGQHNGDTYAAAELANGDLVAGGTFTFVDGTAANRIARRTGTSWQPLGSGMNGAVLTVRELPNGDIVAAGTFTTAGGGPASRIARWDGTSWSPLGTGMNGDVLALALVGGDLVAGGQFTAAGGTPANHIARWNGISWSALGNGTNDAVYALCSLPNGDLVAGGVFTSAGTVLAQRVAVWDGTAWQPRGTGTSGTVYAATALPNGDFLVGGSFTTAGAATVNNLARWDGTSWSGFGTGTDAGVVALATMPNGEVWAGGYFTTVDGDPSLHVARITTTCPAVAMPVLAGCPSSGGSNTLTATTLPWVNTTFRATGTGLPSNALVLTLTSVTAFPQGLVPLSLAFAQAGPGCDLLVAPDILGVLVTNTGTAVSELLLPNVPPIVGVTFYHQLVPWEIGPSGITAVTATNALQLTAGQF